MPLWRDNQTQNILRAPTGELAASSDCCCTEPVDCNKLCSLCAQNACSPTTGCLTDHVFVKIEGIANNGAASCLTPEVLNDIYQLDHLPIPVFPAVCGHVYTENFPGACVVDQESLLVRFDIYQPNANDILFQVHIEYQAVDNPGPNAIPRAQQITTWTKTVGTLAAPPDCCNFLHELALSFNHPGNFGLTEPTLVTIGTDSTTL